MGEIFARESWCRRRCSALANVRLHKAHKCVRPGFDLAESRISRPDRNMFSSKFELTRSRRGHRAAKGSTQPRGANNNGSTQKRNLTTQTNENPPKQQSTPGTGPYSRSGEETSSGAAETSLSTFLLWGDEKKWCETAKNLCGVQCGEGEGAPYIIGTQTICPLRIGYRPPRPTKYPAMIPE